MKSDESRQDFLARMARYLNSANGIPVSRVSLDADDLRDLLNMAQQHDAGRVAESSIPRGVLINRAQYIVGPMIGQTES